MFSMSEVVLLANIKHQERLDEAGVLSGVPVPPRAERRKRVAQTIRALATRLDPSQGEVVPARGRLTPAK